MADGGLAPYGKYRSFLADGQTPNANGLVYFYEAGTSTPKGTQVSRTGAANPNPVTLDSAGMAPVWLLSGQYKIVEHDSSDTPIPGREFDEVAATGDLPNVWTDTGTALYTTKEVYVGATSGSEQLTVVGTASVSSTLTVSGNTTINKAKPVLTLSSTSQDPSGVVGDVNRSGAGETLLIIDGYWDGNEAAEIVFLSGSDTTNKDEGRIEIKTAAAGGTLTNAITINESQVVAIPNLTASQAVFTNGSDELVSNAITGTGNVVMSAGPTLTGTITAAAASFSGNVTTGTSLTVDTNMTITASTLGTTSTIMTISAGSGAGATVSFGDPISPNQLTTTQRDALTASEAMLIYNTTTNKLNFYNGSSWEAVTSA